MFRFFKNLYKLTILGGLLFVLVYLIIEPTILKDIIKIIDNNFDNEVYQLIVIVVITMYFVVIMLSYVEKLFEKRKEVIVKTKSGKIEINFDTLEKVTTNFLETKPVIKSVKVKTIPTTNLPKLISELECFNTEGLNTKLDEIKEELTNHLEKMFGLKLKDIILKVKKIDVDNFLEEEKMNEDLNESVENEQE